MIKFSNKGFTLIELIVVMAVFLLIIGVAVGIFISVVQNQRKILSEQELINQASYAVEHMSKALRVAKKDTIGDVTQGGCLGVDYAGYNYMLTRPVNGFYTGIKFINSSDNDACQEFFLDGYVLKEIKNGSPSAGVAVTSEKLKINSGGAEAMFFERTIVNIVEWLMNYPGTAWRADMRQASSVLYDQSYEY